MDDSPPVTYTITPEHIRINLHPGKYPVLSRLFYLLVFLVTLSILFSEKGNPFHRHGMFGHKLLMGWLGMVFLACYAFFRTVVGHARVRIDGVKQTVRLNSWPAPFFPFAAFSRVELLQSKECKYLYYYALIPNDPATIPSPVRINADFFPSRPEQPEVADKLIPAVLRQVFGAQSDEETIDELIAQAHIPRPECVAPPAQNGEGDDWDPHILLFHLHEEKSYRESAKKKIVVADGKVTFRKRDISSEGLAVFALAFGVFCLSQIIGGHNKATPAPFAPVIVGIVLFLIGGIWCWRRFSASQVIFDIEKRNILCDESKYPIPFSAVTGVKRLKRAGGSYCYALSTQNAPIILTPYYTQGRASPRYMRSVAIPALRRLFALKKSQSAESVENTVTAIQQ